MNKPIRITKVDPEIQKVYNRFMELLTEDVYRTLKVPFQIHTDIKLATHPDDIQKAQDYIFVIKKMMDDCPNTLGSLLTRGKK